eukprot:CAMPEP_0202343484 /NCGR_PEP_ID=MMETSP1126-20121109/3581_1 /ASSEMBLY_ACC=CAM_ASM_000457 /TAXON_ID=3047 /ORGANISM="Dunaliella tertiolecta, Strain CCMP1320" /LENGTH=1166 /DNA_ID=CAMNT_0048934551 /DNA_START=372 /DNA_END=3872 /DNA_ORIENTATION=-
MQKDEVAPQLDALHNCPPHGLSAHQLAELKDRLDLAKARRIASMLPLGIRESAVVVQESSTAAEGTSVLSDLPSSVYLNQEASKHGSLVLGVSAPGGQAMSLLDAVVGKLAPGRMLMSARCKLWWMTPEWRSSTLQIPPETQFLLVELGPPGAGPYALILPLIDGDFRGTLRSPARPHNSPEGSLTLRVESGDNRVVAEKWDSVLHVSAGWDPYLLVEQGVQAAARLSGGAAPRATKLLPPSIDVFGWCTWDAFYSTVSAKGIQEGLSSLSSGGVTPGLLIIDDGWQSTDVDPPFQKGALSPTKLAQLLHLPESEQALLRKTEEDFYSESMEVLAEYAAKLPPGSSASSSMPVLSNLGPKGARQQQQQHQVSLQGTPADQDQQVQPEEQLMQKRELVQLLLDHQRERLRLLLNPEPASPQQDDSNTSSTSSTLAPAPQASREEDVLLVARLGQKVAGWLVGLGTAAFLIFYQWVVEPSPPGSLPNRFFEAIANGILRPTMLSFFAEVSDFTRRLTSVRANSKFCSPSAGPDAVMPSRMQDVVAHLREKFGLRYIYCWHGLPAYWAGVMPDAPEVAHHAASIVYARPTPGVLEIEPSMAWNPAVLAGVGVLSDPAAVYHEMHTYLRDSGVDGVKVDCQAGVGLVGSAMGGGPALSREFHAALEDSIARNFQDNHAINCMCHSTENMYRMAGTSIARASDDFYPRDYASSHPHVAACAFNTLFMSALVHPDWDMFHSKHPAARLHAMARAVSGAAVYVSDKPGQHDFELLRSLVLADGSTLRCVLPGRPTRDVVFSDVLRDGNTMLKIWNTNVGSGPQPSSWQRQPAAARPQPGEEVSPLSPALAELEKLGRGACISGVVSGVVGCFHVQGSSWDRSRRKFWTHDPKPKPLTTQVRPCDVEVLQDIPGVLPSTNFVAYRHNTCSLSVVPYGGAVEVQLDPNMSDIITFTPMLKIGDLDFAPVGLARMLNSGGALRYLRASPPPSPSSSPEATPSSFAAAATATVNAITPTQLSTLPIEHRKGGPDSTVAPALATTTGADQDSSSVGVASTSAVGDNGDGGGGVAAGPSNSIYIGASRLGEGSSPNGVTGLDSLGSGGRNAEGSTGFEGPRVLLGVRGSGMLLMYSSKRPSRVKVQGLPLRFTWEPGTRRLMVDVPQTETLLAELCLEY